MSSIPASIHPPRVTGTEALLGHDTQTVLHSLSMTSDGGQSMERHHMDPVVNLDTAATIANRHFWHARNDEDRRPRHIRQAEKLPREAMGSAVPRVHFASSHGTVGRLQYTRVRSKRNQGGVDHPARHERNQDTALQDLRIVAWTVHFRLPKLCIRGMGRPHCGRAMIDLSRRCRASLQSTTSLRTKI
jgi:hypothetical protein